VILDELDVPIILAPLAGGPSTPALCAAVSEGGGLGFLALGYLTPAQSGERIEKTRRLIRRPYGINLFVPSGEPSPPSVYGPFVERLGAEAERAGIALGEPRWDDDGWEEKLALVAEARPAVVSFTFGCPAPEVLARVQAAGGSAWVTVTSPEEARRAAEAGADALVVQGAEAGGHRGSFADTPDLRVYGLLALLQLVADQVELPLVATGGIATARGVAAALAAGARAAQVGTAFMRCPEAGTSAPHREALASSRPTGLTRAFSGRLARGIVNRLQAEHSAAAPMAYPEVHHVTAPLRAQGRKAGDADVINLWAGQAHELAREVPAAELVAELASEAREALAQAAARFDAAGAR
jgi:nitronate monooxygenase